MEQIIYEYIIISLILIYVSNNVRSVIGTTCLFMLSIFISVSALNDLLNPAIDVYGKALLLTTLIFIYISIGYYNVERRKNDIEE